MSERLPIVVIGGGISGVSCIEQLAQLFTDRPLVLISASDVIKVVSNVRRIGQTIDDLDIIEETKHYLINRYKNIEIIIDKVIELNASRHEVTLESGHRLQYSKVCICSGGKPKLISVSESVKEYVIGIRDTLTVHQLQNAIKSAKRVVIVGNGGIATELVHQIVNCQMVWCIRDDCMSAPYLDSMSAKFFANQLNSTSNPNSDPIVSKRLKYTVINPNKDSSLNNSDHTFGTALGPDWCQNQSLIGSDTNTDTNSIKIEYNCEVINVFKDSESMDVSIKSKISSIDSKDSNESNVWPVLVQLSNHRIYGCDLVISATGVTPNIDPFLKGNNFTLGSDGGLLINSQMMTSEEDVYAAGDVCCVGWQTSEHWFQMRLWTQARQMGVYAALCMAADINHTSADIYFNFDLFAHMTQFFGYKVVLLGLYNGQQLDNSQCRTLVRVCPQQQFVKVILKDNKMFGAVLIGDTDLEETFENLILNQIDLSAFGDDLLNDSIDIDDYFD